MVPQKIFKIRIPKLAQKEFYETNSPTLEICGIFPDLLGKFPDFSRFSKPVDALISKFGRSCMLQIASCNPTFKTTHWGIYFFWYKWFRSYYNVYEYTYYKFPYKYTYNIFLPIFAKKLMPGFISSIEKPQLHSSIRKGGLNFPYFFGIF